MNYLTYDPSGIYVHKSGDGEHDETVEIISADRLIRLTREVAELRSLVSGKPIPVPEFGYTPGPEDVGDRVCRRYEARIHPAARLLVKIGREQWRKGIETYGKPLTANTPNLPRHAAEEMFDIEVYLSAYIEGIVGNEGDLFALNCALNKIREGFHEALTVAIRRGDI